MTPRARAQRGLFLGARRRLRKEETRRAKQTVKGALGNSKFLRDKSGVAAVEFGMVCSLLCFIALGLDDFGMGYWEQIQVGDAARAGGEYAMENGWNQSGIANAVTSATALSSVQASPAPTETCGCPSASAGITAASCGSTCPGGGAAGTYVTVSAQHSFPTIFSYPGLPNPVSLTASVTVRLN